MGVGGLKLIENDDEKKLRGIFPCVDLPYDQWDFFGILPILRKIMKWFLVLFIFRWSRVSSCEH